MVAKLSTALGASAFVACVMGAAAQSSERPAAPAGPPADCSALAGLTFENGTSITAADRVSPGTLKISDAVTIPRLPAFCRVQAVSKPSSDSDIRFEVWLPEPAAWNHKFLSTGEGGFAGQLNYQRPGLDGAMDELLRRGYATASTDTGHLSSDTWWAIGHPEKITDYLYRAKHVSTVAAKAIVARYYGQAAAHSYFSSCSNGGRQGLIEAQRYPDDFDGFERRVRLGCAGACRRRRSDSGRETAGDHERCARGVRQE